MAGLDSLSEFFLKSKSYSYKSGEIILRQDDEPQGVYYIEKGYVKIYSITQDGNEKLHVIYKSGEIFPWIWVFRDNAKSVYYEALGTVVLRRAPKEEFLEFLKTKSSQKNSCELLFELADRIIEVLDIHVDRVANLELTKACPRLVARLLSLAKRFGRKEEKETILDVPLSHQDIANSINMTRETASRELGELERKGLVKYKDRLIIIPSIKKLEKELETHYERKPL